MTEPDLIFEALCEACQIDWHDMTKDQRGRVNAARKQLADLYGDIQTLPEMIAERAVAWKVVYPDIPLTPQSITGNWASIIPAAELVQDRAKETKADQRKVTNAHAKKGCQTCGDDHMVSVGYDSNGNEEVAPCPDCNTSANATYWVNRRKFTPMDPAKTREMMGQ